MTIANIFEIQNKDKYSLIRFFSYVDAGLVEKIRPVLDEQLPERPTYLILDMSKVEFLDSHGVGMFVNLLKKAHRHNGKLLIAGIEGQPASVLQMVGFNNQLVSYVDTVEQARRMLDS